MKTVLFLDQYGNMGGGQQVLLSLVAAAAAEGWRTQALLPAGPCAEELHRRGATVHNAAQCRLSEGRKGLRDVVELVWHAVRTLCAHWVLLRRADMLYANGGHMYLPCFMASVLLRIPAVYHLHLNPSKGHMTMLRFFLRSSRTRCIVVVSRFIERQLHKAHATFHDARVQVIENGLDERFDGVAFKDRFTNKALCHVGVIGRVCAEKGQDVLLPLAEALPQMQFHILGDAAFYDQSYFEELKARAPHNVHCYGWVDDLPSKVDAIGLQLCLVPSRCSPGEESRFFEGSSLVLMQMMALSCLAIPRCLGVLADMAKDFALPSFTSDGELSALLRELASSSAAGLLNQTRANFDRIAYGYSGTAFQKRLRVLFAELRGANVS